MSNVKGSKKGIAKNGNYGVKVAFEYIERQCIKEHLPPPNISGGSRTRLIQKVYGLPYSYWNGTTHKGAVYKYKGYVLWKFIDLFMTDYRATHKTTAKKPGQMSLFDVSEPLAITSKQLDIKEASPEPTTAKHLDYEHPAQVADFEKAAETLKAAVNTFIDCLVRLERGNANGI